MNAYEKIRKALNTGDSCDLLTAMDALAELERASKEPVATVCLITDRFAHNHCIEAQLQASPDTQLPIGTKLYTAPPPAPVAGMREPTPEECERIAFEYHGHGHVQRVSNGRRMFDAVREVMGTKGCGS